MQRTRSDIAYVNGKMVYFGDWYFTNWPFSPPATASMPTNTTTSTTLSDVLAQTNPSRPHVDLPLFFLELREFPLLFWNAGRDIMRDVSRGHLRRVFGLEPLMADIIALLDFTSAVDRRLAHLSRAYARGGVRVTRLLGQSSFQFPEVALGNVMTNITGYYTKANAWRKWCSAAWVPLEDPLLTNPASDAYRTRVFRAMLGSNPRLETVWNAAPWTWLIDWFTDVGSYVSNMNNSLGWVPGQCYTMLHQEATTLHRYVLNQYSRNLVVTPAYYKRETKSRTLGQPSMPTAYIPLLTERQLGILGALSYAKFGKHAWL